MSSVSTSTQADARSRRRARPISAATAGLACAVAAFAFLLMPLPGTTAEAAALGKGIIDYRLEQSGVDVTKVPDYVAEIGQSNLHADWTRVLVHWATLQPTAPTGTEVTDAERYDAAYLARLDAVVKQLSDAGIRIILTPLDVPKWASNDKLWSSGYQPFYAPDMSKGSVASAQFKVLGMFLAARYAGRVDYFECWNEPNQGMYLYPQTPASAKSGGAATYLKMLIQWHDGVRAGNADSVVIGGATAPRGRGDAGSTPPQAFARYLSTHGAAKYMDAYSHHPYVPGGSTHVAPDQLPNNPDRCVTLGNLGQITKLFPRTMPFYLTEFGYNTQASKWFGVTVSPADQARYLRQAYSYTAAHYKRVKALFWFLVDDMPASPGAASSTGVYMGLRQSNGEYKPGWYAFAGGNRLTLAMPTAAKARQAIPVSGVLTHRQPTGATVTAETLSIQARTPSGKVWKTVASVTTDPATGAYSRTVKQAQTKVYRVVWGGVCESAARTVRTR
jgi:hypothetical protein